MKRKDPIAVFAYAFPHRKTHDFLCELAFSGFCDVTVIAAPWKHLSHTDSNRYYSSTLRLTPPAETSSICSALGFSYRECEHADLDSIAALQDDAGFQLGIISGARIIKRPIIELFGEGILNIHPGKLPETAGLDLFYYTITKHVPMGVTAHFIDSRVDAGDELFFEETQLGPNDTIEVVQYNNYQSQLRALRRFLDERDREVLTRQTIDRPRKNDPMTPQEKRAALEEFPNWLIGQYHAQTGRRLLAACGSGDLENVETILSALPELIEFRSEKGWTPLIVAAYFQRADVVRALLALGADPNACGKKGTTVLMYAKTALMGQSNPNFTILGALVDAGADPSRYDALGKDVFHYLNDAGDRRVLEWLTKKQSEL